MYEGIVIADVDGTIAIKGDRGPFEWKRVGEDTPNNPVIQVVKALWQKGFEIIFCSGRMEQCRSTTENWIEKNVGIWPRRLYMRADDDFRSDVELKKEIYETRIKPYFKVILVLDDRDSVVKMWRELGLTCLQVAEGNF